MGLLSASILCERYWVPCFRGPVDRWDSQVFHSKCDNKGPTVTLARKNSFLFGGFADQSWKSKITFAYLCYSFVLYNGKCKDQRQYYAQRCRSFDHLRFRLSYNFNEKVSRYIFKSLEILSCNGVVEPLCITYHLKGELLVNNFSLSYWHNQLPWQREI